MNTVGGRQENAFFLAEIKNNISSPLKRRVELDIGEKKNFSEVSERIAGAGDWLINLESLKDKEVNITNL